MKLEKLIRELQSRNVRFGNDSTKTGEILSLLGKLRYETTVDELRKLDRWSYERMKNVRNTIDRLYNLLPSKDMKFLEKLEDRIVSKKIELSKEMKYVAEKINQYMKVVEKRDK